MQFLPPIFVLTVQVVLDIAISSDHRPVEAKKVVRRNGANDRYLEAVLQALVRGKILRGITGPKGGYQLGRERSEITLADIREVISTVRPKQPAVDVDSALRQTIVGPVTTQLMEGWNKELGEITIEALYQKALQNDPGLIDQEPA